MNEHFQAAQDVDGNRIDRPRPQVPSRAYGRVDHVELHPLSPTTALVAIDLVDADWLDAQERQDDKFARKDVERRTAAWHVYEQQLKRRRKPQSPFANAPIFRLEIESPHVASWLGLPRLPPRGVQTFEADLARLEAAWVELYHISKVADSEEIGAGWLYPGLFAEPIPVTVKGRLPTPAQGKALEDIFSLTHLPAADTSAIQRVLSLSSSEKLAVYDVGQGNANALLSSGCQATLYYDMGAGVYRNRHTSPPGLRFCLSARPPVILSHWDADHWAGACATSVGGAYPALSLDWIAPMQVVGPVHAAFAHDIVTSDGTLHIYTPTAGIMSITKTASGHSAAFTVGSGPTRNNSGIVISVEHSTLQGGPGSWLLTGDCDYGYFMPALSPAPSVGLVVPHHGADLHSGSPPPGPTPVQSYRRIAYSFGKNNAHGKTSVQHPTVSGVTDHVAAGWNHGTWTAPIAQPGDTLAGGEVLATCEHSPGNTRGGMVIGWTVAPLPFGLPCGGAWCTAKVTQS